MTPEHLAEVMKQHERKEAEKVIKRTQDNLSHFALSGFDLEKTYKDAMNKERKDMGLEPIE